MIYRVVLDDTYDLHTSDINCMLLNPSLELEMNSAGSFNFTLPPTHPYWDSIEILKSTIDVYEDDDLIFTGRVANIDKNWNNERVVECEGALAYFNDSIHRQMKWETPLPIASEDPNVHNFLKDILDNHNVFVGDATNRQIHMGHIYVDPYLVTREVDYDKTLDILTRMCIDTNGGYFMIRKDPETHLLYLDWLKDFTEESGQPASFGVNLLDFNTGLHAADICTGVLARGATVNDQVVTLSNVELVDETTYPDISVDHYTTHDQDILWHREGMAKFGRVVQVHEFPDAQTDWKNDGQIVANSLFEEAKKWLEEKNTKIESIEVEVAELSWLQEGVPKYKLGQIVEILDDAHMAGESYEVRRLPMYKLSCDLSSGSKKVTLGRPPKKELTQISASNSDSSTLSSGNSSGSSSGGGSGSGEECKVHDVRVDGTSVVSNKVANISLTGKADVNTVNALAATVATKADASTVNALANVVSGKQDQIEFNTLEAATETLTRLKANNIVYNLGGGTEVEANPSGEATDELEKMRIGQTIYSLPEGGGGSSYFVKDLLYSDETISTIPSSITLSKSWKKYDALAFGFESVYQNRLYSQSCMVLKDHLEIALNSTYSNGGYIPLGNTESGAYIFGKVESETVISGIYGNALRIGPIYGLKFGVKLAGVSSVEYKVLNYIGDGTTSHTIDFGNDTPKEILGIWIDPVDNSNVQYLERMKSVMWGSGYGIAEWTSNNGSGVPSSMSGSTTTRGLRLTYNGNRMTIEGSDADNALNKNNIHYCVCYLIDSIDGSGGGTTVIANPSDPATDDLNTIQIDDTVYNISGSGGSNEHVYTLYDKKTGVWINGFTVFEKVVEISSESTKFLIESGFGDSKSLISVKGCLQEGQTKYAIPDAQFRITVDNDNGLYGNGVDKNWTNISGYLVLEYAKYVGDTLLIYSNIPDIEWEVDADKFQTDEDWQDFVVTGGTATQEIIGGQNVVNVPLAATGTYALTDKTIDRTLYAVVSCLSPNTSGDYGGIIGFMLSESAGNSPMFTEQINTDIVYRNVWGSTYDISTSKSAFIDHVLVLSVDVTNKIAKFYVDGNLIGQAPYNNYGDLRVGSRANGGNQSNVGIKFIGIVDNLDDATVIASNSNNIADHFGLNVTSINLLNYSESTNILVSATPDMFTNGDADWDGIVVDSGVTKITDGSDEVINFPTSSLGTYALSAANQDVTIYAYVKVVTPSRVGRVIGVPYAESTNNYPLIMVYNNNIDYDTYDTNFDTGINFTTTYRIVAFSLNNTTKKAYFYALDDESKIRIKAFSNSGQNILLTKGLDGGNVTESNFKYVGVVNGYEDPNTVWKNMKTIYNHFNQ